MNAAGRSARLPLLITMLVLATPRPPDAAARQLTTQAIVEVVDAPRLTEVTPMQFGRILRPTDGSHSVRLSPAGDRIIEGGGDGRLLDGPVAPGQVAIEAEPGLTILIEVRAGDIGGPGLALSEFEGRYGDGAVVRLDSGPVPFPAVSAGVLTLGAELTGLDASVKPGTHVLPFTVDVSYQ
jgi:hypothetical protein